ncbi:MAG: hemolysin III family protein [Ruminococcaceae bacterium]|nr:hemolysin III family protein [Oscillospiraceae bacterium]
MQKVRIRLRDRILPAYSKGEEIFNMVSHIVGGAVGIATLVFCILIPAWQGSVEGVLCGTVFGVSMVALYTMSSVYHGLRHNLAKRVFQIMDHCTIYFLIAGTYTPILVCCMAKTYPIHAWVTFGAVWGLAVLATVLTAIDLTKYKVFSQICYIGMGWAVIFSMPQAWETLGAQGFALVLGGGVLYTVGVIFFRLGKRIPYFHSVFHLLTLAGSICHALAVMFYVLW